MICWSVQEHTETRIRTRQPNKEEFKKIADEKPGFIKAMWCGCQECEDAIKEEFGVTSRCIPFHQEQLSDKCIYCGRPATKMVYWGKAY